MIESKIVPSIQTYTLSLFEKSRLVRIQIIWGNINIMRTGVTAQSNKLQK